MPPATRPGVGKLVRGDVVVEAGRRHELGARQEHRRRDAHRGRFREQADDVVSHRDVAVAAVPPHVVRNARGDAAEAVARHVQQRPATQGVDGRDDRRVQVGVQRVTERRNEHALASGALLVDVPVNMGVPDRVELLRDDACLGLREHEPVAVVVVPRVILVQLE